MGMNTNEGSVTTFEAALGREIRAQRARAGLGQADIVNADYNLSLSSVQRIEKGGGATTAQLLGLASAFGLTLPKFMAAVEAEAERPAPAPGRGVRARAVVRKSPPVTNDTAREGHDSVSSPTACQ